MSKKISNSILLRVALRTHFMMSAWNFQRMLNIGFLYSIIPAFRVLNLTQEKQKEFLQRHLAFFNTHPYFASYILGLVIKKEEQIADSDETTVNPPDTMQVIESTKRMFMGPFGALGDSFFWGTLRPFLGLIAVLISVLCYSAPKLFWFGPVIFLLTYNIFHEYVRLKGVFVGYRHGEQTIQYIQKLNLQKTMHTIQNLGILFAGMLFGLFAFFSPIHIHLENMSLYLVAALNLVVFLFVAGVFFYGLQKKISTTKLFFAGLGILLILHFIRGSL